jgi:hypothetical protein
MIKFPLFIKGNAKIVEKVTFPESGWEAENKLILGTTRKNIIFQLDYPHF